MTDKELLQEALDALEHHTQMTRFLVSTKKTIKALRARLVQPEQEPVVIDADKTIRLLNNLPRREWVGLTDNEIFEIWSEPRKHWPQLAYAIENKLKEKNT